MPNKTWTLEPEIDAFMKVIELPPNEFMQQLAAERAPIEAAAPKIGEKAPAFSVQRFDVAKGLTDERVSLADYRGQSLALLFGNYTCPIYRGQTERFNEIYAELGGKHAFLLVYISEAHPEDGWQLGINHDQHCVYEQPTDIEARAAIAADCIRERAITMPVAIDDMNNTVNKLYSGSPERLYLIDAEGTVQHRSQSGPFMMDAIEDWYQALRK
jgi:hypothetical protein